MRRVFDAFRETPLLEDVLSVLTKLEQRMSEKERAELAAFGEQFVYMPDHGTKSYAGKDDILDAIQSGIINRRLVRFRYGEAGERGREGYLAPFRMAMYRHGLYAIGARLKAATEDVRASPVRVFAIERFTAAEYLKGTHFEIPADAPLRAILEGSFGPHMPDATGPHQVVVDFSRAKGHLVSSRVWHPTQQLTDKPDGGIRMEVQIPSIAPIVSWVLEWGPHARAIAPTVLVEQVRRELDLAREQYAQ